MNDEETQALSPSDAAQASEAVPAPAAVQAPALGAVHLRGVTLDVYETLLRPMFADGPDAEPSAGEKEKSDERTRMRGASQRGGRSCERRSERNLRTTPGAPRWP